MTATRAGWSEARRVWANPEEGQPAMTREAYYRRLWDYYSNQAFEVLDAYEQYRAVNKLTRNHRSIFNPANRIVKAYEGFLYGGILTANPDRLRLPEGVPLAVRLGEDTEPEIRDALDVLWLWSRWAQNQLLAVRYAAALGNCLVEVVDDLARRKVTFEVHYPGRVKRIELDPQGNVRGYTLEYRVNPTISQYAFTPEERGRLGEERAYTYRKDVTKQEIRYYRDGEPYDYVLDMRDGPNSVLPNPYGFVPAVWVGHFHMGGDYSEPVIWASLAKIDQLNETASLAYDQIAKIIKSPVILKTSSPIGAETVRVPERRPTSEQEDEVGRERIPFLRVPAGAELQAVPLELSQALEWLKAMQAELEDDHPELALFRRMRERAGDLTGPAVERMSRDVAALVYPAMQNYDQSFAALWKMGISIGSMRAHAGAWGPGSGLTAQQRVFLQIAPDAYDRGQLDFEVVPRPLFTPSKLEEWQATQAQVNAQIGKVESLGWSRAEAQRELGKTEEEIVRMRDERIDEQQASMEASMMAFDRGLVGMGGGDGGGGRGRGRADNGEADGGGGGRQGRRPQQGR